MPSLESRLPAARWAVLFCTMFAAACGGQAQHRPDDGVDVGGSTAPAAGAGAKPTPVGVSGSDSGAPDEPSSAGGVGGTHPTVGGMGGAVGADAGAPGAADGGEGGAVSEPPLPSCDPIVLEDPDVEYMLRAAVGKPTAALGPADVAGLTFFSVSGVTSLKGVECLTDLESFSMGELPFGHVTDLSPLASLTKLQDVDIGHNPVASLEPLGKLPQLAQIFANHVSVELDLTPLATAPKLDTLYLQGDTVTDLKPLGGVKTLRTLNLRLGHVVHPEGASALTNVVDFDATGVFTDVAPLAAMTKLEKLRISQKTIENFASLETLGKLKFLDVSNTGISSISPVAHMSQLVELVAARNQITQTEPLGALEHLTYVVLVDNQVVDVGPLVQNPAVDAGDFVYLDRNSLGCAAQAINLQILAARGVHVSSDCP
jgi:hypothetical protein